MPGDYKVALKIVVFKGTEVIVNEEFYFSDVIFSRMANVSDEFYELITKLQKLK